MKNNISSLLFILSLTFFLSACEINVFFKEASPPGVESISSIPGTFQGVYICESDSSRLYASTNVIYQESYVEFVTTLQNVKETESCSILNQGLYLPGRKECVPFEYIGEDSIRAKIYTIDTLFHFKPEKEVAKFYKGRLFLNKKSELDDWLTWMVTPNSDGTLLWELIKVPNDIDDLVDITHSIKDRPVFKLDKDEKQYIINPTLVEFDKILENDYLIKCDVLTPVNFELQ